MRARASSYGAALEQIDGVLEVTLRLLDLPSPKARHPAATLADARSGTVANSDAIAASSASAVRAAARSPVVTSARHSISSPSARPPFCADATHVARRQLRSACRVVAIEGQLRTAEQGQTV